jgi:hypothetical protein
VGLVLFKGDTQANQADFRTGPASSVAIVLNELRGLARWELQIDAVHEGRGQARVGRILTVPFQAYVESYAAQVRQASVRIVAIATCPGAREWRVTGRALPWSPPGYDPAAATPPFDPVVELAAARAEVQITPIVNPTSAPGVQLVNASAPTDVPETATVEGQQVAVGAAAQLVLPEDPDRLRAYLRVVGNVDVFLGAANVAVATGLRLASTDPALPWISRRPLWAVSAGGAQLSLSVDRG